MRYPNRFKIAMIQRMTGANHVTARALSEEVGVAQTTLSKWLREASVGFQSDQYPAIGFFAGTDKEQMTHKRPKDWRPEEKLGTPE